MSAAKKKVVAKHTSSRFTPMQKTLYLTKAEMDLFNTLPAGVKEGWEVKKEGLEFEDSPRKQAMRFQLMKPKSKSLVAFSKSIQKNPSQAELRKLIENLNFSQVSETELRQIFFAIGPSGLSALLQDALKNVKNDQDILFAADLSAARHILLETLTESR